MWFNTTAALGGTLIKKYINISIQYIAYFARVSYVQESKHKHAHKYPEPSTCGGFFVRYGVHARTHSGIRSFDWMDANGMHKFALARTHVRARVPISIGLFMYMQTKSALACVCVFVFAELDSTEPIWKYHCRKKTLCV